MALEIISRLKKQITIMWVVIGTLIVLLAASSAYNVYITRKSTFERKTEAYYTVPERQETLCISQADKKRKKVK